MDGSSSYRMTLTSRRDYARVKHYTYIFEICATRFQQQVLEGTCVVARGFDNQHKQIPATVCTRRPAATLLQQAICLLLAVELYSCIACSRLLVALMAVLLFVARTIHEIIGRRRNGIIVNRLRKQITTVGTL